MAGSAIIALHVVRSIDSGGAGLHGKTDINVAEPAGKFGAVQPMVEYDRGLAPGLGKIIENDSAELVGERASIFDAVLGKGDGGKDKNEHSCKTKFSFHFSLTMHRFYRISMRLKSIGERHSCQ